MEHYFDNIFEKVYNTEDSTLWYKARHFVMDILPPLDGNGIKINDSKHIHVIFDELNRNTLAIARQIALIAHYPNFNEKTGRNRTVITFYNCKSGNDISINNIQEVKSINKFVDFGKLLDYCLYTYTEKKENGEYQDARENEMYQDITFNNNLPLDIEFEFKTEKYYGQNKGNSCIVIESAEVESVFKSSVKPEIDITKGVYVNMAYSTGATIDNLPACDNDNVIRYDTALNVYCYKLKTEHIKDVWDATAKPNKNGEYNEVDIKNQLSSIFCADCFKSRLKSILDTTDKSVEEYLSLHFNEVMDTLCSDNDNYKVINALAHCEHNRWNVEKLILGFSPLRSKDMYDLECLFDKARKDKIKALKKEKRHIDLCSNNDIRRVNPADVKYDYFLMLAIPHILLEQLK